MESARCGEMAHPYPKHLASFHYRGKYLYALTFTTHERERHFVKSEVVQLVLLQILRAAQEQAVCVIAYCFMPDHLHLLVEGLDEKSACLEFVRSAKQYSGYYFARRHNSRLWQRYSFERVLRSAGERSRAIRYITGNPVRAGLVPHPADYPFLGSQCYSFVELLDEAARAAAGPSA
jgi:putative transposase